MREGEDINDPEVCDKIGREHHERSDKYIREHWRKIELSDETEAAVIRLICRAPAVRRI